MTTKSQLNHNISEDLLVPTHHVNLMLSQNNAKIQVCFIYKCFQRKSVDWRVEFASPFRVYELGTGVYPARALKVSVLLLLSITPTSHSILSLIPRLLSTKHTFNIFCLKFFC